MRQLLINSGVNHIVITVEQHALYAYTDTADGLLCEPSKVTLPEYQKITLTA